MTKACYIIVSVFLLPLIIIHFYSCNTAKQYHRPDIVTDSVYYNVKHGDSSNIALIKWENIFSDTLLKKLIRGGIENNLDLKIAIQRIDEAESFLKQRGAERFPDLKVETQTGITRQSDNSVKGLTDNKPVANYRVGLSSSWEIDLWGKLRSARRSAYAELLKTEAIKRSVQTKLIADIATEYYNLLLYRSQEKIIELTIRNREEDLETVKLMKNAAMLTEAAVKQSEAQVYAAKILLPKLRTQINISSNAINIFLGKMPSRIESGDLDDSPQLTIDTLPGYPAQLLVNRPDVFSSEQSLRASFENTNVARANFYPSLSIT
ncbi:MAG: TolC family protein, partial [Bacteroidota bacterium]|nr:TolC family protein [Bacteroidota bacterium]